MIALPTPIAAVTAAAIEAGLTPWLAIDADIVCPESACWQGRICVRTGLDTFDEVGWCSTCDGSGRVPLVVEVGDTLTVRISDELPAEGTEFGPWSVEYADDESDDMVILRHVHALSGIQVEFHPLRPGGSLPGTVAAVLPIYASGDWPDDLSTAWVRALKHGGAIFYDGKGESFDIETWGQDFTPGMRAFRLTDVTVTP